MFDASTLAPYIYQQLCAINITSFPETPVNRILTIKHK